MDTPLTKKTKAELIAAYEDLRARQQELESGAQQVLSEERTKTFTAATSAFSNDTLQKTIGTLRGASGNALNQLASAFEQELRKFEELRKAITLAEERLKIVSGLEMSADVATRLLAVYETERAQLEQDIIRKKRDFEREHEDREYQTTLARKRTEEQAEEARKKRERELAEREAALVVREHGAEELRKRVEGFDAAVEKETTARIAEAKKAWDAEEKRILGDKDREREQAEKMYALEKKTMEQEITRMQSECIALRKEAELANRKAQDLAMKIVERGSGERTLPIAERVQ